MPRRLAVAAVAWLIATVVAGCGETVIYANEETGSLATSAALAKTWTPTEQEPVVLGVEMPSSVPVGGVLKIRVRVHNGTPHPLAIGFGRSQGFDVIIAQTGVRADTGAVWSPLKLYTTTRDATVTDPLPAGRDTTFDVQWPTTDDLGHSVPPGHYRVRAMVEAELMRTRRIWSPWQPVDVVQMAAR